MKVLTAAAMREADRRTIEELGFPEAVLMESAGMRVVEAIFALQPSPQRVLVVAGPGNNGGDGLVVARLLQQAGREVSLWITVPPEKYRGAALMNYQFLVHREFPVKHILDYTELGLFQADLGRVDLVVDALFGIGLDRPVEGLPAEIIKAINGCGAPVLAVDLPSGVHADSGKVMGCAVKARWTVTFAFPKPGLLQYPGGELAGEVLVGDINIPSFLASEKEASVATAQQIRELLPPRPAEAHKGSFGRVLLLAGSTGMSGAAALAAAAALRGGAGLVYLAAPASICPALEAQLCEAITVPLPETAPGLLDPLAAELLLEKAAGCSVLAAGPGLAAAEETAAVLKRLMGECPLPLVLDAGALGALALLPEGEREKLLREASQPPLLTPHPGEMARLVRQPLGEVQQARPQMARLKAREWNSIIVLKGAGTVVASPGGELYFNPTGGPALATAGTGDLLTGLIASLIAQGMPPFGAAVAGAYIHGLAGDLLPEGRSAIASDILARFPEAFQYLEREAAAASSWGPYNRKLRPV
ncbi:MAG: NAD(P)H-hydrate dehydratase [Firmicutes bacterium]|nr:NAD(P)H-hydrate dehydratase [Bacillota bacterium]HPU00963.1 NAD(P)H-hydrate dehydratase [Bacillota bacterium]